MTARAEAGADQPKKRPPTKTAAGAKTGARRARSAADGMAQPEERQRYIAEAAYFLSERRGFSPGAELDDWLEAEAVIDRTLFATQH